MKQHKMKYMNFKNDEERLKFENLLWIVFIFLSFLNIIGNGLEIQSIRYDDKKEENKANQIFEFTLFLTLLLYLYFFQRNYHEFQKTTPEQKRLYAIKVFGATFLIVGTLCLLYFQRQETDFVGAPAL